MTNTRTPRRRRQIATRSLCQGVLEIVEDEQQIALAERVEAARGQPVAVKLVASAEAMVETRKSGEAGSERHKDDALRERLATQAYAMRVLPLPPSPTGQQAAGRILKAACKVGQLALAVEGAARGEMGAARDKRASSGEARDRRCLPFVCCEAFIPACEPSRAVNSCQSDLIIHHASLLLARGIQPLRPEGNS